MPIFARYDFSDTGTVLRDGSAVAGQQDGSYLNGADGNWLNTGWAFFDGHNDYARIAKSSAFQLDRGTLDLTFRPKAWGCDETQTILSRDTAGLTEGGFRIELLSDGALRITHETDCGKAVFCTAPCFVSPEDCIRLTYSWDAASAKGGSLLISNLTDGTTFGAAVPSGLTMDMGCMNEAWLIGAGSGACGPDDFFNGTIDVLTFSDTVDTHPVRDGIVSGTAAADLIDLAYTGDPDGDRVDAQDAILPGAAPDDDLIRAFGGNDTVRALAADDEVYGGDGDDLVEGGAGNDTLHGEADNDTLIGGSGEDTLYGGEGANLLRGGDPSRGILAQVGQSPDLLVGGSGLDRVEGASGNDTLRGNGGADILAGGIGSDLIEGGDGADLIVADRDLNAAGTAIDDPRSDYRAALLLEPGNDMLFGGSGNDSIWGQDGNDTIEGGDGANLLIGGTGADVITAGNQGDVIYGDEDGTYASAGGTETGDTLIGGAGRDTIFGGNGNDLIQGLGDNDSLFGGNGGDTVDGGEGDDTLDGGNDQDSMLGGGGQDSLYGDNGNDTLDGGEGNDRLDGGNGIDGLFGGSGQDTLQGGNADDSLFGGTGDDILAGDLGNDQLQGGDGQDSLTGAAGDDTLTGGEGVDTLSGGDDRDTFVADANDKVFGGSGGDDYDVLDLSGIPRFRVVDRVTDSDGNGFDGKVEILNASGGVDGSFTFENIEFVPCFTPGTLIATPKGERPVEDLRPGDRVVTRDNGIQEIRWVGAKTLDHATLARNPHLNPVLIRQGSLGHGLPERDMMVSPNHRMLVANDRTSLYFDEHEVLVAAKHLVAAQGICEVTSAGVSYIHVMFDRHEVLLSEGAWTESFQPGDYALKGIGNAQRSEIFELFPDLRSDAGVAAYAPARRVLKQHEARVLIR